MRLTEQQVNFFETFGFLSFPGLFADDVSRIVESFEQVWGQHGGGHNGQAHDYQQRSTIVPFIDQHDYLSGLLDDPRIDGVVSTLLGDDYNYSASDGNLYAADTGWHSDGYMKRKYRSIKVAFYLDRLTKDTGCLRVIPGSHRFGDVYADTVEKNVRQSLETLGIPGSEVPCVPLEIVPGDLVLFDHTLKHAAFGGSGRRRMFTLNFSQRYREEDLPDIRRGLERRAYMFFNFANGRAYGDAMLRTAGPARLRHLEQSLANDAGLAEFAEKGRQELAEPSRDGGRIRRKGETALQRMS